jgi:nitrogen regulatory protein PII
MKEIRVIVAGEQRAFVTDLLDRVNATGYTIIGNVSGKGHHGVREAHFMFSEQESLEMIMTVVPEDKVEPILAGLRPLFERHSGVMFVADVAVSRQEYFATKSKQALWVFSVHGPALSSRRQVVYNGRLVAGS